MSTLSEAAVHAIAPKFNIFIDLRKEGQAGSTQKRSLFTIRSSKTLLDLKEIIAEKYNGKDGWELIPGNMQELIFNGKPMESLEARLNTFNFNYKERNIITITERDDVDELYDAALLRKAGTQSGRLKLSIKKILLYMIAFSLNLAGAYYFYKGGKKRTKRKK